MAHDPHRVFQPVGQMIQNRHRICKGAWRWIGGERIETPARVPQQFLDRWFNLLGSNLIEGDAELKMKKWIRLAMDIRLHFTAAALSG